MWWALQARAAATCMASSKSVMGSWAAWRTDSVSVWTTLTNWVSWMMNSRVEMSPQRITRDTTPRQRAVLELLYPAEDGLALREIRDQLASIGSERQIRGDLTTLLTLGLAQVKGKGRGARWHLQGEN